MPQIRMPAQQLHAEVYSTESDLLEGLVDDVKLLSLLWQLGPNVTGQEDALKVHPLALDHHPHLGSREGGRHRVRPWYWYE